LFARIGLGTRPWTYPMRWYDEHTEGVHIRQVESGIDGVSSI